MIISRFDFICETLKKNVIVEAKNKIRKTRKSRGITISSEILLDRLDAINLFSRSSLEGGLTLGDNIRREWPFVGVDHDDSKGPTALKEDGRGADEREVDEPRGEKRGWEKKLEGIAKG